jgi:hypothetical protein
MFCSGEWGGLAKQVHCIGSRLASRNEIINNRNAAISGRNVERGLSDLIARLSRRARPVLEQGLDLQHIPNTNRFEQHAALGGV